MSKPKLVVNYVTISHDWGNGEQTSVSVSAHDAYPDAMAQATSEAMHAFSEAYCFVRARDDAEDKHD
jgi:hypothetical protein